MDQCYICHKPIKLYNYRNHIAYHLMGNATETRLAPDSTLHTLSYDVGGYDHHNTKLLANSTVPRLRVRTAQEGGRQLRPVTTNKPPQSNGVGDSLAPPVVAENSREAHFTSAHLAVGPTIVSDSIQRGTPEGPPTQPNAFQTWLNNYVRNSPQYTTIDGEKSDSELPAFRQAAQILRGTTKEEVVKIVEEFEGFSYRDDQKTCLELVRKAPIFPGLVAYTYTHLIMCPRRGWLGWVYNDDWSDRVSELNQLIELWSKYDDISCILFCDKLKERLHTILRATRVFPQEHKCNTALLNGKLILRYDVLNLAALTALCITGPRKGDILDQGGVQIGTLIELIHNLLESDVNLQDCYRRRFFSVVIALSKESGFCPQGIYITEGTITSLEWKSRGGFGVVYRGKLGSHLVAVKTLKRGDRTSLLDYSMQLAREAIVWKYLRHPNCLPLYGVYFMPMEGQNLSAALVSPWMDRGTLSSHLRQHPEANRTKLILDVVRGLNYLHTMKPHVVHRDIKPDNILVTKKGRACLADFGLVSAFDVNDHLHTNASQVEMGGTFDYMAPEIFLAVDGEARRRVNKRACDMYALGCTIYSVYTDRRPFHGKSPLFIRDNVTSGRRPELGLDKIPHDMLSLVENLWNQDPSKRLTTEMALDWMEVKASQEGVDLSLEPPAEQEWEWNYQSDEGCLWSVSL